MTIPTIHLGDGLEVSQLGFGGMALSHVYGDVNEEQAERTLHAAIDCGITFIDTANVYGKPRPGTTGLAGTNEELVGRVLASRRDEVQLATKFGITGLSNNPETRVRGDREYVRQCCEESLRRLGVDTIDLYYMHRPDLSRPIEETVQAMAELVREGKVRHLGLSEVTAPELRAAMTVHPIAAVQSEWSVWSRDVENHVVPAASELGVGFVPYSPLGRGFLTGTLTKEKIQASILADQPRYDQNFDANQVVVAELRAVATNYVVDGLTATPAQVALAWLRKQGERYGLPVVPIPGTSKIERVQENAGSLAVDLTDEEMQRLDEVSKNVQGERNFTFTGPNWLSHHRE